MAISANGMIAIKDGGEDFLSHENWNRFVKFASKIGCFIWGRKTYEAVVGWEGDYLNDLKDVRKVIISRTKINLKEGFTLANSPEEAIKQLETEDFEQAIITGGSIVNSEFAKRRLIDEVILDVNPIILGEGIPVFAKDVFEMKLELLEFEKVGKEIVELRYKVVKEN